MYLSELDKRDINVVILQSNSIKMSMFIKDRVKRKYHGNVNTIIDVNKKSDLKLVKEVIGIVPPFSEKWVIYVDMSSVDVKDISNIIQLSTTCVFCCETDNYKTFKELKDTLKNLKVTDVFDYYINYLKRNDLVYLYDAFVPEDKRMVKTLFDYVVQSYSGDVEAVLNLFLELAGGKEIKNRKDIADICGIGGLSIESFIFSLVKEPSKSERGLKKVMKTRVQAGRELGAMYGYSTFYNFMRKSLMNMIDIKILIMSGNIYKSIRSVPNGYDEKSLSRYQKYVWKLKEIPLTRLLRIVSCMGNKRWRTEADFLNFYYNFVTHSYSDGSVNLKEVCK